MGWSQSCASWPLERDCCSFAAWSVRSEGADVTLEVTAEGEGVAAVRALFVEPAAAPAIR